MLTTLIKPRSFPPTQKQNKKILLTVIMISFGLSEAVLLLQGELVSLPPRPTIVFVKERQREI